MNERIKELAEETGFLTKDGNFYADSFDAINEEVHDFAELIIRKCFDIVNDFGIEQAAVPETFLGESLNVSMKITDAAYKIKEYFGVEE